MGRVLVTVLALFALLLLGFLSIFMINFTEEETIKSESSMEGKLVLIEERQILVVQGVTDEEVDELDEEELIDIADGAAYFTITEEDKIEELEVGMEVRVWYDILDASDPASGISTGIEVLN